MHPVYHHVEMRVILVAMRHDEHLVLVEIKIAEYAIGNPGNGVPISWIGSIEGN
jgi:hypothetical protein